MERTTGAAVLGAGVMPYCVEPSTGEVYFVVGRDRRGWGYFGGRCDGESPERTASKELLEETIGLINVPPRVFLDGEYTARITSRMPMTSRFRREAWADYVVFLLQVPWDPDIRARFRSTRRTLQNAEHSESELARMECPRPVAEAIGRFKHAVHIMRVYLPDVTPCAACNRQDDTPRSVRNYLYDDVRLKQTRLMKMPGAWCETCVERCHLDGKLTNMVVKLRMGTDAASVVTLALCGVEFDSRWVLGVLKAEAGRARALQLNNPAVRQLTSTGGHTTSIHVRKRFLEKKAVRLITREQVDAVIADETQLRMFHAARDILTNWESVCGDEDGDGEDDDGEDDDDEDGDGEDDDDEDDDGEDDDDKYSIGDPWDDYDTYIAVEPDAPLYLVDDNM